MNAGLPISADRAKEEQENLSPYFHDPETVVLRVWFTYRPYTSGCENVDELMALYST